MKFNVKLFLAISLLLCLISSLGACIFQTDFGRVEYHDMTFVTQSGHELDALLLVPKSATADSKAPAIVVSHGWYNNREMQDLNYVEYARRGYVVLAISMYGHGDSEVIESNTWWDDQNNANGLYDGVKYLADLPQDQKSLHRWHHHGHCRLHPDCYEYAHRLINLTVCPNKRTVFPCMWKDGSFTR